MFKNLIRCIFVDIDLPETEELSQKDEELLNMLKSVRIDSQGPPPPVSNIWLGQSFKCSYILRHLMKNLPYLASHYSAMGK